MEPKIGYGINQIIHQHKKMLKEKEDIVYNLSLPIERDYEVVVSLVKDLKEISKRIDDLEKKVVWTDRLM